MGKEVIVMPAKLLSEHLIMSIKLYQSELQIPKPVDTEKLDVLGMLRQCINDELDSCAKWIDKCPRTSWLDKLEESVWWFNSHCNDTYSNEFYRLHLFYIESTIRGWIRRVIKNPWDIWIVSSISIDDFYITNEGDFRIKEWEAAKARGQL